MNAYVYQAELICEPCGDKVKTRLDSLGQTPVDADDEHTFDSDDYPKGPYPDGGGEADSPNHCGICHVALGNSVIPPIGYNQAVEDFLDELRDSGKTNMMGAGPFLQARFGMDRHDAKSFVLYWMHTKEVSS
jgi:hypothetical protein